MKKIIQKISKTIPQTSEEPDSMSTLETKLKACDPEIQNYVFALQAENLKLQKQIAKLQANNVTLKNRIKVLEAEEYRPKPQLIIMGPDKTHEAPPEK